MHETITEKIKIPEGIEATIDSPNLKIKGAQGENTREFPVEIKKEGDLLIINVENATKKDKKIIKTSAAHIKNMINGAKEGYEYLLQICSVHFPITASVSGDTFNIKNFLGEAKERKAKIVPGVKVKIEGDIVKVTSSNIESAGQTAANIEIATKIKNRDKSRFQDGIWIIQKANKELE